jgi:hypothetical protein
MAPYIHVHVPSPQDQPTPLSPIATFVLCQVCRQIVLARKPFPAEWADGLIQVVFFSPVSQIVEPLGERSLTVIAKPVIPPPYLSRPRREHRCRILLHKGVRICRPIRVVSGIFWLRGRDAKSLLFGRRLCIDIGGSTAVPKLTCFTAQAEVRLKDRAGLHEGRNATNRQREDTQ